MPLTLVATMQQHFKNGQNNNNNNNSNNFTASTFFSTSSMSSTGGLLFVVLKVFSDLVDAIEKGKFPMLSFLDLLVAFDTVNHEILLERLSTTFGIKSVVLW